MEDFEYECKQLGDTLAKLAYREQDDFESYMRETIKLVTMSSLSSLTTTIGISVQMGKIKENDFVDLINKAKNKLAENLLEFQIGFGNDFSEFSDEKLKYFVESRELPDKLKDAVRRELYKRGLK